MNVRGIDFSGSARPGTDTWITEGRLDDGRLSVSACRSATDRFGVERRPAVLGEVRSLLETEPGATGLDFSFGLPAALLPEEIETWAEATEWFAGTFDDDDAATMRETLKERGRALPGDGVELKRRTDTAVGANSPYSFITYYQTLYGIRDVLFPLVRSGAVRTPPMDAPGGRNVIEIYPAGTLRRLDTVATEYKDDTETGRRRRERIVDRLLETADVTLEISPSVRRTVINGAGGDALDSLVGAVATARAAENGFEPRGEFDAREGCIYS